MAYTLHATGKSVTVAQAEKFAKETGFAIATGIQAGGWFCFSMGSAATRTADKALAAKYFKGALLETTAERNKRFKAAPARQPVVALLSADDHAKIARSIKVKNPGLTVRELCNLVGDANNAYSTANGNLEHNAHDYYAVQSALMSM